MAKRLLILTAAAWVFAQAVPQAGPQSAWAAVREPSGVSGSANTGAGSSAASTDRSGAGSAASEMETEGSISAIDLKASPPTMQVSSAGETRTLRVPSGITIRSGDGRTASLDQFRVGQRVRVKYATENGREVAKSIELAEAQTNRPAGTELRS